MLGSVLAAAGGKGGIAALALRRLRLRTHDIDAALRGAGDWLMRNQRTIRAVQWLVVLVYFALLIVPVLLPLPPRVAHIWTNVTLLSQFVFWGIWWPFVLLSMVLVGRLWCGLLCPEGSLSEAASAKSRGHALPRWIKWKGWPFAAFAATTIYGQMISVYQYPKPALVILGFSTVAAIAVALFWGRNKRVWCRYLCPVTGVFALLSKLAPVHFRVDKTAWDAWKKPPGGVAARVDCAPLVPIRTMHGAGACHMCGRCSGFHEAITLARRSPNDEIVHVAGREPDSVETLLILFGLLGIAVGAFHWAGSGLYIDAKQAIAAWLIDHGIVWPVEASAPWWILTNYADRNDVMTLLDGAVMIGYILALALGIGFFTGACVALATGLLGPVVGALSPHRPELHSARGLRRLSRPVDDDRNPAAAGGLRPRLGWTAAGHDAIRRVRVVRVARLPHSVLAGRRRAAADSRDGPHRASRCGERRGVGRAVLDHLSRRQTR
ncbi:MAG: 4Fe-4S binding protein [Xanthobacteraceae bacterium]